MEPPSIFSLFSLLSKKLNKLNKLNIQEEVQYRGRIESARSAAILLVGWCYAIHHLPIFSDSRFSQIRFLLETEPPSEYSAYSAY